MSIKYLENSWSLPASHPSFFLIWDTAEWYTYNKKTAALIKNTKQSKQFTKAGVLILLFEKNSTHRKVEKHNQAESSRDYQWKGMKKWRWLLTLMSPFALVSMMSCFTTHFYLTLEAEMPSQLSPSSIRRKLKGSNSSISKHFIIYRRPRLDTNLG